MILGSPLASALGVPRDVGPQTVAEYLLRHGGRTVMGADIPDRPARWFTDLAAELGNYLNGEYNVGRRDLYDLDVVAPRVAEESMARLHRADASLVLALIEPDLVVGGCPAKDLGTYCKSRVRSHLPAFCRRVLRSWEEDEHITDLAALRDRADL